MKCTEFELIVNEYVDNEIEDKSIEEHIKTCDSCRKLYEETLEIKNLLSGLDVIDLPEDFEESLHDKLVDAKNEMKVVPLTSRFKLIGSIAAVAVLSILAFRAGTLMPLGTSSDNAMETANIAYNMDMADDADVESLGMAEEALVADEAVEAELTYSANAKAIRMDNPLNYAKESVTYFISPIESRPFDEIWLEGFDFKELIYLDMTIEFYIQESDFEKFNEIMYSNLIVDNSVILDNEGYISEKEIVYDEAKSDLKALEDSLEEADSDEKAEIEESINIERGQIEALEYDVQNIEYYKGYKKIIIKWEE